MKKLLIRFFLSLCILLLSGYSQLYAHTYQDCICHSSKKILLSPEHASFGAVQNNQTLLLKSASSITENENSKLVATAFECEDEESISFKKFLENSNYFTTVFHALVFGFFCLFLKKRLLSSKHSIYFSSYKWYLLFCVFRI